MASENSYEWKPLEKTDEASFVDVFSVPILQVQLDLNIEQMTEFCFDMWEKDKEGKQKSNIGGWQSNNIITEEHSEFQKLIIEIRKYTSTYQSRVGFKKELHPVIREAWINFNEKNNFNSQHIHSGNGVVFSGAYYVKADDPSNCGPIVFQHPLSPYLNTMWKIKDMEKMNMINSNIITIHPKPNLLLMFPSWLQHSVLPNNTNSTRISMSFNTLYPPSFFEKS